MNPRTVNRIRSERTTLGSWITLGHTGIVEILSRAGFDWLVIDLEHSTIGIESAAEMIRTADLCGVSALVRLTSNSQDQIKRVLDAGAHGIVVPSVSSASEAARAVSATRYPPAGNRGVGLARAQGYGARFKEYLRWQADGPIVVVQIETAEAVQNIDEILSTRGVDAFMIGPYDLSSSLGVAGKFSHPRYLSAVKTIRQAGRKLRCRSGIHVVEPDPKQLRRAIRNGYSFIAYSADIRILDVSARAGVRAGRNAR